MVVHSLKFQVAQSWYTALYQGWAIIQYYRDTVIMYLVIIVPCHLLQYRNIVFTVYHDIATIYRNTVMLFAYKSLNTKQILLISSFNSQKTPIISD